MKCIKVIFIIVILIIPLTAFGQKNRVSGIVTDSSGEPLIGATVVLKGSDKGTTTDLDGKFQLNIKHKGTLVVSYIGYLKKEVQIKDSSIKVILKEDSEMIDEVVVVGYSTMRRSDLTGSVGVVNMNDIENTPVNSIDQALGGRISGLTVISPDGQPGSEASFVIRGTGSMNSDAGPLFVIDGFPQESSDFSALNPDDIQSLTVLKDASSTAIYGSRGANGVILVTTKRGAQEKPTISYKGSVGFQSPTKTMEVLNAHEFAQLQYDLYEQLMVKKSMGLASSINATGWMQKTWFSNDRDIESYRNSKTIDWQDKLFRNAITQNHTLSVSGKSSKTAYYMSLNYSKQDGLIKTTGFDRYSGRVSVDQTINKNLKVGVNASYSATTSYGTTASGGSSAGEALMNNIYMYRPTSWNDQTLYDLEYQIRDRGYGDEENAWPSGDLERINPYITTINEHKTLDRNDLSFNAYVEYRFLKNFKLKVSGGYSDRTNKNEAFYNEMTRQGTPETNKGTNAGPNGSISSNKSISLLNENILSYDKVFKKKHSVNLLAGFTLQKNKSDSFGYSAEQVPNAELGVKSLELGTITNATSGGSQTALMSYLGRANYAFDSKYLITATFRSDGSSKFAKGHQWGIFPSGALAWRFTREKFMKGISSVLNDGKLRMSVGYAGNNKVGDFASLATINTTTNDRYQFGDILNTVGSYPSSIVNNELTWEKTGTINIGVDLGFFKDRIRIELDYYKRNTTNLLLKSAIAANSGFGSMQRNVGEIQNKGFEFTFNTENIRTRNFRWTSSFNISFNKNKILSFASGEKSILSNVKYLDEAYISQVGGPVAQYYGYITEGVYQLEDFDIMQTGQTVMNVFGEQVPVLRYSLKSHLPYAERSREYTLPGYLKFKDLNDDGVIDSKDRVIIGSPYPKHIGGFTNNFDYKGFSLNVFFTWSYGAKILYGTPLAMINTTDHRGFGQNRFAYLKDYWTEKNPYSKYPSLVTGGSRLMGTHNLEDGSYLRLKNISLSYNVPKKFIMKLGLSSLRLNVSAQNIWTWTKYIGQDPEVSANYSALTPMYDNSSYPRTKNITFGLNATL